MLREAPRRPVKKPEPGHLLTYRQVAEQLGVSERSVYSWAKAGDIAVTRLSRLVRVHPDEVERVKREGIGHTSAAS